jgi:DNA-binding LytR/AlgR family response regulator
MHKVLIVEDNVDLAENIYLLLKETGFEAAYAHTGDKGMKMIIENRPDIILCDIMLPDINGYKLLSELKKLEDKIIPIFIFLTAKTQRDDVRKGMTVGADDYITKPFTNEELLNSINAQLAKRKKIVKRLNNIYATDTERKVTRDAAGNSTRVSANGLEYDDHIFINDKKYPGFYLVKEIIYIRSLKDYTRIYMADDKKYLMRKPMIFWAKTLPKAEFIRIHRQTIINLNHIDKVEPLSSNRFQIFLKNSAKKIAVSQRYSKKLKHFFN